MPWLIKQSKTIAEKKCCWSVILILMCPSMKTNNGLLQVQCGALDWLIVRLGTAIFGPVPLFATIPYFIFCISCTGHDPPTFSTNLVRSDEEIDEIMRVQEMATVYCFFQQTAQQVLRGFSSTAFRSSFLLPNSFRKRIPTNEFPNSLPWTCFFIELRPSNFSSFFYLCGLAF